MPLHDRLLQESYIFAEELLKRKQIKYKFDRRIRKEVVASYL